MGVLVDSTSDIVKTTSWIIENLAYGLSEMGEGDFTVRSKNPSMYVQGWRPLYEAIHKIISGVTNLVIDTLGLICFLFLNILFYIQHKDKYYR